MLNKKGSQLVGKQNKRGTWRSNIRKKIERENKAQAGLEVLVFCLIFFWTLRSPLRVSCLANLVLH